MYKFFRQTSKPCCAYKILAAGRVQSVEQAFRRAFESIKPTDFVCVGVFRRAFRSRLDKSLQPYSVRIPAGFDASHRYPLLVYLHGSGDDDRGMLESLELPETLLAMAPRARGTSHVYVQDHAKEDIQEAIQDMIANYPVVRNSLQPNRQ